MTKNEKKEIGINISILMDTIRDQGADSTEVANCAISFCIEMLKKFPDLQEYTEDAVRDDWDKKVSWIKWKRNNIDNH